MTNTSGKRSKKVRRSVIIADRIADHVIKIGGILVIATVLGILVFLVYEVIPLFRGGEVQAVHEFKMPSMIPDMAFATVDEYKTVAVAVDRRGTVRAFHTRTGTPLDASSFDFGAAQATAWSRSMDGKSVAFGFSDGTVRFGAIHMDSEILAAKDVPKDLKKLDRWDGTDGRSIYSTIPGDQVRKITVSTALSPELVVSETSSPIVAIQHRGEASPDRPGRTFVAMDSNGVATLNRSVSRKNLLTGEVSEKITRSILPTPPHPGSLAYIVLAEGADQVYLAEKSGRVNRYSVGSGDSPVLAEKADTLPRGVTLTSFGLLLGEQSLVVGGSDGSLGILFRLRREHTGTPDGYGLIQARKPEPHSSSVTGLEPGRRGRTFVTTDAQGHIWLRHATSERTLLRLNPDTRHGKIIAAAFAPRGDGVLSIQEDGAVTFRDVSVPHPETSVHSLFGKVWYESYPEPSYTWQSSGATEDFEPKLSLVPLIFGTFKATIYSLLFAIPIALLAAVYTSEFVHPSVRATVKPIMEMMASLPSVILGFVAALVLAPIVESWIAAVLLTFVVVPFALVLAAHLWQMVPLPIAIRFEGLPKLFAIAGVVAGALFCCYKLGPGFETLFFSGDFKQWLISASHSPAPLLFMLLVPVVTVAVVLGFSRFSYGGRRGLRGERTAFRASAIRLVRWLGLLGTGAGVSYLLALLLSSYGVDPRGSVVGTYVQRNSLVVGFAMGFAVIPIIYTLAEDALNAVPDHLRSASLACGATPWQTAMWVILPTAISGVFSAIMIGMGRAVGETMIVVMAAGNTPLIDMNVFNGLRALSANIAVELPEAVKDGSLYRVLFLTALVLFSMTFVINTVAEIVRLRFRKRAMQL